MVARAVFSSELLIMLDAGLNYLGGLVKMSFRAQINRICLLIEIVEFE